jgi:hypothetical protein
MDTLAHGLWAYLLGRGTRQRQRWALLGLISAGPDLIWLPFTLLHYLSNGNLMFFPLPYQLSHSLVLWAAFTTIASLRWKNFWRWSWPWALHIVIDIPGHIGASNQTPILWPISDFSIRGIFDWLTPQMLLVNYSFLFFIFIFVKIREQKKKFAKNT